MATTYSPNLRIPHLDQNVAQPEIPENTAKNIIDSFLTAVYTITTISATDDIVITHADDPTQPTLWQSFIFDVVEGVVLTNAITITLPDNSRPYTLSNKTSQTVNFKTTNGSNIVSISAGGNGYAYSDGSELTILSLGAASTFMSLNDTPLTGTGSEGFTVKVALDGSIEFIDQRNSTIWKGLWQDGTFIQGDMVRDGIYLMVANKTTTDRAAPQNIYGLKVTPAEATAYITATNISVVEMIHNVTMSKTGWLKELKVKAPTVTANSLARVTFYNVTNAETKVFDNIILSGGFWYTVATNNYIVQSGDVLKITFEFYNADPASEIEGRWNSNLGTGIPADMSFNIDNLATPTIIDIDYTDLDTVDRQAVIDNIAIGSIITISETANIDRTVTAKVTAVDVITTSLTSLQLTVTTLSNGARDIRSGKPCIVDINVPIIVTSDYYELAGEFTANPASFGTITTSLEYDGVDQAKPTDTAYGISLSFQEATISADWDFMAIS